MLKFGFFIFLLVVGESASQANTLTSFDLEQKLMDMGYTPSVARKFVEYDRETVMKGVVEGSIDLKPMLLYRGVGLLPKELRYTNPPGEYYTLGRIYFDDKVSGYVVRPAIYGPNGQGTILQVQLPSYLVTTERTFTVSPEKLPNLWPFVSRFSLLEREGLLGHKGVNWQEESELLKERSDLKVVHSKTTCYEIFKNLK